MWPEARQCGGTRASSGGWRGCGSRTDPARRSNASTTPTPRRTWTSCSRSGRRRGRRVRLATFNEVLDAWVEAGCPKAAVSKRSRRAKAKSPNTIATIGYLFDGHVRPQIGGLRVDRTQTPRVEQVFAVMAEAGYATSTIDHTWTYLNQALRWRSGRGWSRPTRRPMCCCRRRGRRARASRSRCRRCRRCCGWGSRWTSSPSP